MQKQVTIESDGLALSGVLHVPADHRPGQRRPAMVLLHGFGSTMKASNVTVPTSLFSEWGYVVLRFDRRGCGSSGGEPGLNLCPDHVTDTRNAITWLATRPEVDPNRIGLAGNSFGGAIAIYTAGVDRRVAAVISSGGWGDGARKLRGQHPTEEGWAGFLAMLKEGQARRSDGRPPLKVHRFDIVPIPPHLRGGLPADAIMEFPFETAESIYNFRPDDVVPQIAPRPILFLHAAPDSVTPTDESIEMFRRARQPAELHLFNGVDHFMMGEGDPRVTDTLRGWLTRNLPAAS